MAKQQQTRIKPVKKEAPQAEKQIRPAEETVVTGEAQAKKAMLEREIRRYVKRTGGFRANLHKEDKQEGRRLIKSGTRPTIPIVSLKTVGIRSTSRATTTWTTTRTCGT